MISVDYGEPENKPPDVRINAVSGDRICDLKIMSPTRYQLRHHRHALEPTDSPQKQSFRLLESAAKRAGDLCGCARGRSAIPHDDDFEALALALAPE